MQITHTHTHTHTDVRIKPLDSSHKRQPLTQLIPRSLHKSRQVEGDHRPRKERERPVIYCHPSTTLPGLFPHPVIVRNTLFFSSLPCPEFSLAFFAFGLAMPRLSVTSRESVGALKNCGMPALFFLLSLPLSLSFVLSYCTFPLLRAGLG